MTAPRITVWARGDDPQALFDKEWLVTNGLGGYAAGTLGGAGTRRFHGALIAALPAPLGRILFLGQVEESLSAGGASVPLSGREDATGLHLPDLDCLDSVMLVNGLPVWRYHGENWSMEKMVFMPHLQNTTYVRYSFGDACAPGQLVLRPFFHFRPHEGRVDEALRHPAVHEKRHAVLVTSEGCPPLTLRLMGEGCDYQAQRRDYHGVRYRVEQRRGYDGVGMISSPGRIRVPFAAGTTFTLAVSVEPEEGSGDGMTPEAVLQAELDRRAQCLSRAHPVLRDGDAAQLVLAADQFIVLPNTRIMDSMRAHLEGDEARTIIAGYHWFTDWGRDSMISLEGLCLHTGRREEARCILRTFAHHVRDGLIPNMFPEGGREGLYHTADATLWFFHAIDRYVALSGDRATLRILLPTLKSIIDKHLCGTRFGIRLDERDGLLVQGEPRLQLTWMDAKVGDWVVTPRRGKAVEINALFHNALLLLAGWLEEEGEQGAGELRGHARRLFHSFNRRFWNPSCGYLFDVVDGEDGEGGNDAALRPNQLFAFSLRHPVLEQRYWEPVLKVVEQHLLTPVGLRSLAPDHPDYKPVYSGDLRARDAAYHQGTVWAWLIGPFIDAWLKVHPEQPEKAPDYLRGFSAHLTETGVGSISEIYDAQAPYAPRGCIAQAWSVAEVLRCLMNTHEAVSRHAELMERGG